MSELMLDITYEPLYEGLCLLYPPGNMCRYRPCACNYSTTLESKLELGRMNYQGGGISSTLIALGPHDLQRDLELSCRLSQILLVLL
jgi:hypothetical protein